jgi:hypothetical protein
MRDMTTTVDAAFAEINGSYPIADYTVHEDDSVTFTCDDGDTGIIYPDGRWNWTAE